MKHLALILILVTACGQPPLPKPGDRCEHRQASWTFCNEAGEQIVCETTGRLPPDDALWFFNGQCTGREGFFCQIDPTKTYCEGL